MNVLFTNFKILRNAYLISNKVNYFSDNLTLKITTTNTININNNRYVNSAAKIQYLTSSITTNLIIKSQTRTSTNLTRNQDFSTNLSNYQQSLLLVRFPNPLLWMKMKWRFKKLNYFWDPEFNEGDFIRGARQALVTITHLIGDNNFDDLNGLLTKDALQKLRQEVTLTWPEILKHHIPLNHHHIKAITPINIRMMENIRNERRFCDVDILYIALKRIMQKEKNNHRILVFNILSRFHRNYSDGAIPNWTVAIFTMDVVAHKPKW